MQARSGFPANFLLPKLAQHYGTGGRRLLEVDQDIREGLGPRIAIQIANPTSTLVIWQREEMLDVAAERTESTESIA